jgi:hypothetical protein
MTQYTKESLRKHSGGGQTARTKYTVPTLKFNGNTGIITRFPAGNFKDGEEQPKEIILVGLRRRRIYSSYEKSSNGAIRRFTNEHNNYADHITIFEAVGSQKTKALKSGVIEELRNEFPKLRINDNLYLLYMDEVHKMNVRGKSRQALVDYVKDLAKDGKELFEVETKVGVMQGQGQGGNVFYHLTFESGNDSDLDKIGPHMEKMGETLDTIDSEYKSYNDRIAQRESEKPKEEEPNGHPEITADAVDKEEIDVSKIPF